MKTKGIILGRGWKQRVQFEGRDENKGYNLGRGMETKGVCQMLFGKLAPARVAGFSSTNDKIKTV